MQARDIELKKGLCMVERRVVCCSIEKGIANIEVVSSMDVMNRDNADLVIFLRG